MMCENGNKEANKDKVEREVNKLIPSPSIAKKIRGYFYRYMTDSEGTITSESEEDKVVLDALYNVKRYGRYTVRIYKRVRAAPENVTEDLL